VQLKSSHGVATQKADQDTVTRDVQVRISAHVVCVLVWVKFECRHISRLRHRCAAQAYLTYMHTPGGYIPNNSG
jgi:hypothetical protein